MRKEYIIVLGNYEDYINIREMTDQCIDYYVYGKKLVNCNEEQEVLSYYIYEIEKTKVKSILDKILWEGAIRYVGG